jgi:hypothetical protein
MRGERIVIELLIRNEDLVRRVFEITERVRRSVEAVLDAALTAYENASEPLPNPLLLMAQMAEQAKFTFEDDNAARRSRVILEDEYADYLPRRMKGDDEPNPNAG